MTRVRCGCMHYSRLNSTTVTNNITKTGVMSESESSSDLSLAMECLSSSCESLLSDTIESTGCSRPYQFEPCLSSDNEDIEEENVHGPTDRDDRLNNIDWCTCGYCVSMPTVDECCCCQELASVREKIEEKPEINCITDHPGFSEVCLSMYALETAYYHYKQYHGRGEIQAQEVHRKFRYTAYRQLVRWCWRYLGRKVRVPLPACVVTKIRDRFPSQEFAGFKYPQLD